MREHFRRCVKLNSYSPWKWKALAFSCRTKLRPLSRLYIVRNVLVYRIHLFYVDYIFRQRYICTMFVQHTHKHTIWCELEIGFVSFYVCVLVMLDCPQLCYDLDKYSVYPPCKLYYMYCLHTHTRISTHMDFQTYNLNMYSCMCLSY